MTERPSNIRNVCAAHAPKPDPTVQQHPPHWYIGTCVKRAFVDGDYKEHMWIRVTSAADGRLWGAWQTFPRWSQPWRTGTS
jgi:hypothetical protein